MKSEIKPIFRWTVGPCRPEGLVILKHAVREALRAFGETYFDWLICYNNLEDRDLRYLEQIIAGTPVKLYQQSWDHSTIKQKFIPTAKSLNQFKSIGSLWKVCPARINIDTHEIIVDNDLIILKRFEEINNFLTTTDKALILEDPIRWFGRYDRNFQKNIKFNSGLIGLPPNYNFGDHIERIWEQFGSYSDLSNADEQGLLCHTLVSTLSCITIPKSKIAHVHPSGHPAITKVNFARDDLTGIHFVRANRESHQGWKEYLSSRILQ